jgi:HEAT repeat protein
VLVPILIKSLDDSDIYIRANAAFVLGIYGEEAKTAVPAISQLLRDSDEYAKKVSD